MREFFKLYMYISGLKKTVLDLLIPAPTVKIISHLPVDLGRSFLEGLLESLLLMLFIGLAEFLLKKRQKKWTKTENYDAKFS